MLLWETLLILSWLVSVSFSSYICPRESHVMQMHPYGDAHAERNLSLLPMVTYNLQVNFLSQYSYKMIALCYNGWGELDGNI